MQTFVKTAAALAALMAATAYGDTATAARVLGYQDTQTGTFHPLARAVPDATIAPTTGTVEVSFTIKLVTTFAKGTTINCGIDVSAVAENLTTFSFTDYGETAGSLATISGSTATCSATIPYSWLVPAASTTEKTSFSGGYTVAAYPAATSATSVLTAYRSSTGGFQASAAIPPSGTISKYTVNVTL